MIITYEVIQVYPDPLAQTTNMSRVFINQECRVKHYHISSLFSFFLRADCEPECVCVSEMYFNAPLL